MVNFLLTTLFGAIFVWCMVFLNIGCMMLMRILIILWFDVDFVQKIYNWFKSYDAGAK